MTVVSSTESSSSSSNGYQYAPPWTGPSRLVTIRTGKCQPFNSLLKSSFKEFTGFQKHQRQGAVRLGHMGFEADEHEYLPHRSPERAILQYNSDHYSRWKAFLKDIKVKDNERRDSLLEIGGFGENIAVANSANTPAMDEATMCVGDLVSFQTPDGTEHARVRVNGFRMPCYKLNHRFGIPNMSQRVQDKGWTGWMYAVEKEGDVEVGDLMVLLERPFPEWPVSRIQYYCYTEPRNMSVTKVLLETLGERLATDARELFRNRLTKGMEDMSLRLQGSQLHDVLTDFKLCDKIRQTDRVSEFIFERVNKIPSDSKRCMVAKSGSHVRLSLKVNDQQIVRPYSVISGDSNRFSLGVALADKSRGGSAYIHQILKINDIIKASETFANTFALETEDVDEHVFLAGGIGITAFLDHIRYCIDANQSFQLHYMIRNQSDYAFGPLIESMLANADQTRAKATVYVSANGGRCNMQQLLTTFVKKSRTHIYVCGSEQMAEDIKTQSQTLILDGRVHFEQFSIDASGDPFVVETSLSNKKLKVHNRQSLLEALRDVGLDIPSSCEAGNCGTCRIRVRCGRVLHKGTGLIEDEKAGYGGDESGDMLVCVSRGVGTISIEV